MNYINEAWLKNCTLTEANAEATKFKSLGKKHTIREESGKVFNMVVYELEDHFYVELLEIDEEEDL